jgi:VWFA-related protein
MKTLLVILLVILTTSLSVSTLQAQSGRKKPASKPEAEQGNSATSPQPQPAANEETVEGSESKTPEGGESVEDDVIRVDTSLVTVPVTVLDRSGKYVPFLRRQDFHLFEDGVEQKIAYFATVDSPFTVVLMIDTSGSTQFRLEDIQDAAITFVSKLKMEDSVMVLSFDDRIEVLSKPTTDRAVVNRAIRRTRTGGGTRLYDAVDQVLTKHLQTIAGRKAVVLFTDGVDTTSRRATYSSTLREAEEADAPIYTIDYDTQGAGGIMSGQGMPGRGGIIFGIPIPRPGVPGSGGGGAPGSNPGDYRRGVAYLHALSDNTGGRFYSADTLMGISQAFAWIAEELGRQYSLGYYPKRVAQAGQRRAIKVRVNEPEMVVKARGSYIPAQRKGPPSSIPAAVEPVKDKQPYGK